MPVYSIDGKKVAENICVEFTILCNFFSPQMKYETGKTKCRLRTILNIGNNSLVFMT